MRKPNIAILGATGVVGREILKITNELNVEFEEIGIIFEGINIVYFNENDIVRYLTTDDDFNIRFIINGHEFNISSDLYWALENQFNFNFHKTSYKIHVY